MWDIEEHFCCDIVHNVEAQTLQWQEELLILILYISKTMGVFREKMSCKLKVNCNSEISWIKHMSYKSMYKKGKN